MTVKNIISQEVIEIPAYIKDNISRYGWLVATYDRKVLFFSVFDDTVEMDDVTNHYEKI